MSVSFSFFHIAALDSKTPKAEDIEEEDDDVPGRTSHKCDRPALTLLFSAFKGIIDRRG